MSSESLEVSYSRTKFGKLKTENNVGGRRGSGGRAYIFRLIMNET